MSCNREEIDIFVFRKLLNYCSDCGSLVMCQSYTLVRELGAKEFDHITGDNLLQKMGDNCRCQPFRRIESFLRNDAFAAHHDAFAKCKLAGVKRASLMQIPGDREVIGSEPNVSAPS